MFNCNTFVIIKNSSGRKTSIYKKVCAAWQRPYCIWYNVAARIHSPTSIFIYFPSEDFSVGSCVKAKLSGAGASLNWRFLFIYSTCSWCIWQCISHSPSQLVSLCSFSHLYLLPQATPIMAKRKGGRRIREIFKKCDVVALILENQ